MKNTGMIVLAACAALVLAAPVAADPTVLGPVADGHGDDAAVSALKGQFVRVVISDRPDLGGRTREEAFFVATAESRLTLVGITAINYVDRDRDQQPDAGEVREAALVSMDAESDGSPHSYGTDDYLARAAEAARRAVDAGELAADARFVARR